MNILFLSFYYPPDLCAGSFRAEAMIKEILKKLKKDDRVTLITTKPNRYSSYHKVSKKIENKGNLKIIRIDIPNHKNKFFDQAFCFIFFALGAIKYSRKNHYDIVIGTSSRLFTAALSGLISQMKSIPLYLDIRDIFLDVFNDIAPKRIAKILYPFLKYIENRTFSSAKKINIVSSGFLDYFKKNYKGIDISVYPNGIDNEFLQYDWSSPSNQKIKVCYAGNIGDGQGLHKLIPDLAGKLRASHDFFIIGGGGKLTELKDSLDNKKLSNVYINPAVGRLDLIKFYDSADILFLHLNNLPAFDKVIPSKLYEYAATGKPIIAGVDGCAREFILKEIKNSKIFSPCDYNDALKAFSDIEIGLVDRSDFIEKYDRSKIMKRMANDIVSLI